MIVKKKKKKNDKKMLNLFCMPFYQADWDVGELAWPCQHGRPCDCTGGEGPGCSTDLVMSPNVTQHAQQRGVGGRLMEAPACLPACLQAMCIKAH